MGKMGIVSDDELVIGIKTAPRCWVCNILLVARPQHGYSYNPPFVPPRNYCAEHGYPWEQIVEHTP